MGIFGDTPKKRYSLLDVEPWALA